MRYLHPVAPHERWIASGTYEWVAVATHQMVAMEHWTVHEHPDGARFYRVDYDARQADGTTELVELWQSPPHEGARLERVEVLLFTPPAQRLRMGLQLGGDGSLIATASDRTSHDERVLDSPTPAFIFPRSTLYRGYLLQTLSAMPIFFHARSLTMLSVAQLSIESLAPDAVTFTANGEHPFSGSMRWDQDGIPQEGQWLSDQAYRFTMKRYTHR
ncbi:MAG: hypothetical protein ACOYLB_03255 [Phototrophicaceae bacterium]